MGQDQLAQLLAVMRESITRIESSATSSAQLLVLQRALAHLWSAHDELEALSTRRRWGHGR
jgi:DNA-binding XRE family transcriptional regulator